MFNNMPFFSPFLNPSALFFARSKNQALAIDNLNNALFSFLPTYAEFSNICLTNFEWKFPAENEQLNSDFNELLLFYKGRSALINTGDTGYMLCDFNAIDRHFNMFGYPTLIEAIDIFNDNKVLGQFSSDNFVIIPNNRIWYPTNYTVLKYSVDIANIIEAMDLNVEAQKFPVVLQGTPEQKTTLQQIANKIETGDKYIFLDKNYNVDDIKTLFINAPFISKELDEIKERKRAELLTKIGINNANVYKESGINESETNANNNLVSYNLESFITPRLNAIKEIKSKFDIDVSLKFRGRGLTENESIYNLIESLYQSGGPSDEQ